ncbi:hypothetical protein H4R20_002304 [Coemansia guatemalensis]|uniref:NAD(P)-binding protein n=1 Tax=Coemansia guatemalensis TaxID=2761395 RepID=A0A9W8HVE1_9FUNG|nr:hypothetical protein H4R20_002304 [Coemansia guatemalensis]
MHITELLRRSTAYTVDDKVVVVTGALSAVGQQLVRRLVELGARVALVDSAADGSGERLSNEINNSTQHESSIYIRTDLRRLDDIRLMVEVTVLTFGRMDVLVNNAEHYAAELTGSEDAQRICDSIDINLRAPVAATWVFARYLHQSGNEGVAVNVAAMAGLVPGRGREVYGAANAGLIHFTEASRALAPQLRVCALAPYYVDTPVDMDGQQRMLPGQRLGSLLTLSSDQVVASVVRCIEDTTLAGRTIVLAGESTYSHSWSYFLSHIHMVLIMFCSMLVLVIQRLFGRRVAQWLRSLSARVAEEVEAHSSATDDAVVVDNGEHQPDCPAHEPRSSAADGSKKEV